MYAVKRVDGSRCCRCDNAGNVISSQVPIRFSDVSELTHTFDKYPTLGVNDGRLILIRYSTEQRIRKFATTGNNNDTESQEESTQRCTNSLALVDRDLRLRASVHVST